MRDSNPEFAHHFIETRLGFHDYVERTRNTDPNIVDKDQIIVDINLTGINQPADFNSFADIEREYDYLLDNLSENEPDRAVLLNKIQADRMLLRVLQGEEVSFDEFALSTIGLIPKMVPEEDITVMRNRVELLLDQRGIDFTDSPDGKKKFQELLIIKDQAEIERLFKQAATLSRLAVGRYVEISGSTISPEFLNDESLHWSGYVSTHQNGQLFMKFNTHPSRLYTPGRIKSLMFHEDGGHVVQLSEWKEAIDKGEVSPAAGLIAIHSPETTHAEAVTAFAETLIYEVAETDEEKWMADYQTAYNLYQRAVTHNSHLMINYGSTLEECVAYDMERLPFDDEAYHCSVLEAVRDLPTYRSGFAVYQPAYELIKPILSKENEEKQKAIQALYERSLTPQQIGQLVK